MLIWEDEKGCLYLKSIPNLLKQFFLQGRSKMQIIIERRVWPSDVIEFKVEQYYGEKMKKAINCLPVEVLLYSRDDE